MLSSGTLNLKFMQRGKAAQANNQSSSLQQSRSINQTSTKVALDKDPSSKEDQKKRKFDSIQDDEVNNREPEIVYEDSLISFPLLSSSSSFKLSFSNLNPPHYVGRKSYGEFNKAIEKLGVQNIEDVKVDANQANGKSEPQSDTKKLKKKEKHKSSDQSTIAFINQEPTIRETQRNFSSSSSRKDLLIKNNSVIETKSGGFMKPFSSSTSSTTSFQKQKSATSSSFSNNQKRSLQADHSSSRSNPKKSKLSKSKNHDDNEPVSILSSSNHDSYENGSDSEDEDDELVNQQIESMFLEARRKAASSSSKTKLMK